MIELPFAELRVFVATTREAVPEGCTRYLSVDGSVPGAAITWDHHLSGETINLMAMPDTFDASAYQGVGTTMADTDALASVVAVMAGGKSRLPVRVRATLEAASHRCDHLGPLRGASDEIDALGRGLNGFVADALAKVSKDERSAEFARLCRHVARCVEAEMPLPFDSDTYDESRRRAEALDQAGGIVRGEHIALIDLRGRDSLGWEAIYERIASTVAVALQEHRTGGLRYTVGINPFVALAPKELRPALEALAEAEFLHGAPALAATPTPGAENWGGRSTVFGSPWNYASRLLPDEVVAIVERALLLDSSRSRLLIGM